MTPWDTPTPAGAYVSGYRPAGVPVKMQDATAGAVAPASNAPAGEEKSLFHMSARNVSGHELRTSQKERKR